MNVLLIKHSYNETELFQKIYMLYYTAMYHINYFEINFNSNITTNVNTNHLLTSEHFVGVVSLTFV